MGQALILDRQGPWPDSDLSTSICSTVAPSDLSGGAEWRRVPCYPLGWELAVFREFRRRTRGRLRSRCERDIEGTYEDADSQFEYGSRYSLDMKEVQ